MPNVVYSKSSGLNDTAFGKYEKPIKAIIESESNICEKNRTIRNELFIIEKSNRFGEAIVSETEFGAFQAAAEGAGAENDAIQDGFKKFVEHIQFMKEFTITASMAEDAVNGIAASMRQRPKMFTRAYYKTQNDLAAKALANGHKSTMVFNKATVDLTTGDGKPLFSKSHLFVKAEHKNKSQSNYFCGNIASDAATFERALATLSNKMRNFKDENNENLGYIANYIIIPDNRPDFETMVKKVVGSERTVGSNNNDINTQYGNWTVVVLPGWETTDDRFMIMSGEANENLMGNLFFNRIPLTVTNWVDNHTGNYIWNGRCRFGVGFGTWKHILLAVHTPTTALSEATALEGFPITAAG